MAGVKDTDCHNTMYSILSFVIWGKRLNLSKPPFPLVSSWVITASISEHRPLQHLSDYPAVWAVRRMSFLITITTQCPVAAFTISPGCPGKRHRVLKTKPTKQQIHQSRTTYNPRDPGDSRRSQVSPSRVSRVHSAPASRGQRLALPLPAGRGARFSKNKYTTLSCIYISDNCWTSWEVKYSPDIARTSCMLPGNPDCLPGYFTPRCPGRFLTWGSHKWICGKYLLHCLLCLLSQTKGTDFKSTVLAIRSRDRRPYIIGVQLWKMSQMGKSKNTK